MLDSVFKRWRWGVLFFAAVLPAAAQVKTDGSLGARQTLTGPAVIVPHTLGQIHGSNLFHSFEEFNVTAGGSVTFQGPGTINNVLARVTGSAASHIDGALRCDIPNANLFLMNPAGVVFGAGATLDVQGSFVVTTADRIHLSDGGRFAATVTPGDSVLSSAHPVAFGFLAARPASITVDGATLAVPQGKVMAMIGGDVAIHGGSLSSADGRLVIAAVASPGTVNADAADPDAPVSLTGITDRAAATIDGQTQVTTAGGGMIVRAGDVTIDAAIRDQNAATHPGRGIDVDATRSLEFTGGIVSLTVGDAAASPVSLTAPDLTLRGGKIDMLSGRDATGAVGAVALSADRLTLTENSSILSSSAGSGAPGDVTLIGRQSIRMDQNSSVSTDSGGLATGTHGGDIHVRTGGMLTILDSAELTADSFGTVAAGNITIDAADVMLDAQGQPGATTIGSSALDTGRGGDVTIRTGSMSLLAGATISTITSGPNVGGAINLVVAGNLTIDGTNQGDYARTGLFADSQPGALGNAGSIFIQADQFKLKDTGELSASAFGLGRGGDIQVRARTIVIEGVPNGSDPAIPPTGIISVSLPDISGGDLAAGAAGNIHVKATESLTVSSANATISSDALGDGPAGSVTIDAGRVALQMQASIESVSFGAIGGIGAAGQVKVFANDVELADGRISAITTGAGAGGNVTVAAARIALHGAAAISSSTGLADDFDVNPYQPPDTFGLGGDVIITARQSLTLDGTAVIAAATLTKGQPSAGGHGGNVILTAHDATVSGAARITVETDNAAAGGSINATVAGQLLVRGAGAGFDATTSSPTSGGAGGDIVIQAGGLRLRGGGEITVSTAGAGDAGRIDLAADVLRITDAGITAITRGPGRGGDMTLHVGSLTLDGAAAINASTGASSSTDTNIPASYGPAGGVSIFANSVILSDAASITSATRTFGAAGAGGTGGNVRIDASDVSITGAARISVATDNAAAGGSIHLNATGQLIVSGNGAQLDATTSHPTAGGAGGDLTINVGALELNDGAKITAATSGAGNAGGVNIVTRTARLSDASIATTTTGSGNGGNVTLHADALSLAGAASIAASTGVADLAPAMVHTFGAAGDVTITASTVSMSGTSAISSATHTNGLAGGGSGGDVQIDANELSLTDAARISVATDNAAAGGSIHITAAGAVVIDGPASGIDATTSHPVEPGKGGNIVIHAADLLVSNRSDISSSSSGAGDAGAVELLAGTFSLSRGARVQSASTGRGRGSDVTVRVDGDADISGGARMSVASNTTAAGDLLLAAHAIHLDQATLSAEAGGNGGNIKLTAPTLIDIRRSTVTAQSGGNGGRISIDPTFVVLQNSTINGLAQGKPVDVTIQAQQFVKSSDSQILTQSLSAPPQTDVAGTLLTLPTALFATDLTLKAACPMIMGYENSSFLIVGRKGTPPTPGGLLPAFDFAQDRDADYRRPANP